MTNQIRAIRRLRGLSPETVAEAVGVNRSTVYRWESGESDPGSVALCRLADLLGVTTDALLGREDNTNEGGFNHGRREQFQAERDPERGGTVRQQTGRDGAVQSPGENYQLEKILALCEATGQRPSEVVNEMLDYALARARVTPRLKARITVNTRQTAELDDIIRLYGERPVFSAEPTHEGNVMEIELTNEIALARETPGV